MIVGAVIFAVGCFFGAALVVAGQSVEGGRDSCKCHERK